MAAGWQTGGVCHVTADLAGATLCSQTYGVTSSGVLACTGYTVTGDNVELALSTGSPVTVPLQPCERLTYADTWGPIFGYILIATVVIWGLKKLASPFKHGGINE